MDPQIHRPFSGDEQEQAEEQPSPMLLANGRWLAALLGSKEGLVLVKKIGSALFS